MVLKYYAHPEREKREVWRDLSAEIIECWEIYPESRLGYKGGNLYIHFQTWHLPKISGIDTRGGVHPPIPQILNYEEVLSYLRKNFGHLEQSGDRFISTSAESEIGAVKKENKISFGTKLRKLFN
jgi:hypothetical protein